MFPLTHMAVARQVLEKDNAMIVTGAIFPDDCAYLGFSRNTCHVLSLDLFDYCREYWPDELYLDFVRASLTHSTVLPGLDFYADEEYGGELRGYCFQRGEKLVPQVMAACHLERGLAYWKAHNFVEMAFEVLTAERIPTIGDRVTSLLPRLETIFPATFLARYLNRSEEQIVEMYRAVAQHFSFDGHDVPEMASRFARHIANSFGVEQADTEEAAAIVMAARELVADEYDDFMAMTVANIRRDIKPFL